MTDPIEPVAARKPIERKHHGHEFVDAYEWLRDKDDPQVIEYLEAENAYTAARTEHLGTLRETIFNEIAARTKQTDLSVPYRRSGFWQYSRTVEGLQYQIHCRVPAMGDEPPRIDDGPIDGEQVLLDGNEVAGLSAFFAFGTLNTSPDGRLLAYSTDLIGDERFTLRIRNLATGTDLADEISGISYSSAWSADASVIFYVTVDHAWRPDKIWRHVVGTEASSDVVVFAEPDERFWVSVGLSRNNRAIQIDVGSELTSEVWLIPAADPMAAPAVVAPREHGVEYQVEHAGDRLLIIHNVHEVNFSLSSAALSTPGRDYWEPLIAGSPESRLLGIDAFAGHAVLHERRNGLTSLAVLHRESSTPTGFTEPHYLEFDEPIYTLTPGSNAEWATNTYRFSFGSMVTPDTVYDYLLDTGDLMLRKQQTVQGGVDLTRYRQRREWATAADGTRIPLSIVARSQREDLGDALVGGDAPVVLYGYGAYEHSIDPYFSISRLSLLDRGVVFVIAHVRGGGELGRRWYDQGKMMSKKNTFTDFIAAARYLVDTGWTRPQRIVAQGGSAGGLLMGAVANMAPEAFGGILAQVPFVDALTTLLDPSLPLTVTEWEEWGNPLEDPEAYSYLCSYTPYENVAPKPYPAILAVTSLNDTRVFYVEPTKWVAKLRSMSPTSSAVLLKTEMQAGHGGRSGRYDAWRETAFSLAWQLDVLGIAAD